MSKTISELQAELEAVISWFESAEANIDEAEAQYKRGLQLTEEIEQRLQQTKNNITKLKESFAENE